nr:hypothetical protein [uncultured Brevundimonas sp.]
MEITQNDLDRIGAAIASQSALDYAECGPHAPYTRKTYKGVTIEGRYDSIAEYRSMEAIVDRIPELLVRRLQSIWCDSKACAAYSVIIRKNMASVLLLEVVLATFSHFGFNSLDVSCEDEMLLVENGCWPNESV